MTEQAIAQEQREINPEGWKNPPKLADLLADFRGAKETHDAQVTRVNTWLENMAGTGNAVPKVREGNSKIVPKLIRKQAEWRYSSLSEPFLSGPDLFEVRPRTWEDREAAIQNALLLNYQMDVEIGRVEFIDEYVRTAVDEGTVFVKVGWDFQAEEVEEQVPEIELIPAPEMAEQYAQLDMLLEENPNEYYTNVPLEFQTAHEHWQQEGVAYFPKVIGTTTVLAQKTVVNRPTLEICDYRNVIVDPTCKGNLKDAKFVIHSFEASMSDLQKDGKYTNLELVNVSNNTILGEPDHAAENSTNFNFDDKARQKLVVYEYWGFWDIDGSGRLRPIVCAWIGDTVVRLGLNPHPHKSIPFVKVQYLPVRKRIHGEPDGHLLEDNQKILGAVTRGMIDIMGKSANGQTGIRKDALDPVNRRRYDKGLDYEFNPSVVPEAAFYMHKYPEIPASAQFMLQMQNLEAESLTGVKAFTQGISSEALGNVATGIRGALDAASKRELNIVRRLAAGIIEIGRMIMAMNAVFLKPEEVIRVTNEKFVTIRRDELAGKFDLVINVTTAEQDNAKAQELAFMLQTYGPNAPTQLAQMIMADIARLRKMPDLAEKIENFQPQPDPIAEKMRELELAELDAKIADIRASTAKKLADAGLAEARARNVDSETDINNLDFVEQESGVKQARDLQRIGEQARSNIELETHKANLENRKGAKEILANYLKKS